MPTPEDWEKLEQWATTTPKWADDCTIRCWQIHTWDRAKIVWTYHKISERSATKTRHICGCAIKTVTRWVERFEQWGFAPFANEYENAIRAKAELDVYLEQKTKERKEKAATKAAAEDEMVRRWKLKMAQLSALP